MNWAVSQGERGAGSFEEDHRALDGMTTCLGHAVLALGIVVPGLAQGTGDHNALISWRSPNQVWR
jgi:hypothetical protein